MLLLDILWTRAVDLNITASYHAAFHYALLLLSVGGWRPKSILQIQYQDIEFGWARDPGDPELTHLVATIRINQVKKNPNQVQRNQHYI